MKKVLEERGYYVEATGKYTRDLQAKSHAEARKFFQEFKNEGATLTRVRSKGLGWFRGYFVGPHSVCCSATGPKAAREIVRKLKYLHPDATITKVGRLSGESGS